MELKPRAQITPLLTNELLARVEHLRLNSSRRFTNRHRGEHIAGRAGQSIEFRDYRDYTPGDDTRFVDWNIFARLRRPYIKLYQEEEEMHVVVLIDASNSMLFEEKLERAKSLGAAFGVMGLLATERVSVHAFNQIDQRLMSMRPRSGRAAVLDVLKFIESIEGGGNETLELGIEELLKTHRGRGVIVVLSDFLTTGDLQRSLNALFSHGLEVFGLQILGPSELDPELTGDLRMVDSETGETLDVSAVGDLVGLYHEYRDAFQRRLETLCRQRSGRFVSTSAGEPLEAVLFDTLRRQGWVR